VSVLASEFQGGDRRRPQVRLMSALLPKADMVQHDRDVRFVPKADSCSAANFSLSSASAVSDEILVFIEQIGPQVVAREEQKLSVDWIW
jgi:hypothetical protein